MLIRVFLSDAAEINRGKVIDLFLLNWYYESGASHHIYNNVYIKSVR